MTASWKLNDRIVCFYMASYISLVHYFWVGSWPSFRVEELTGATTLCLLDSNPKVEWLARVLLHGKLYQPSLIFLGMIKAFLSVEELTGATPHGLHDSKPKAKWLDSVLLHGKLFQPSLIFWVGSWPSLRIEELTGATTLGLHDSKLKAIWQASVPFSW